MEFTLYTQKSETKKKSITSTSSNRSDKIRTCGLRLPKTAL